MPTVQFSGKIHPSAFNVNINDIPPIKWEAKELGLEMVFKIQIRDSDVRVECELNKYDASDFLAVWMRAFDLSRAAVNLCGFANAVGATVTLDTFMDPEQARSTVVLHDQRLAGICTAFRLGESPDTDFSTILAIVLGDPALFLAINDLITAITLPHESPVVSARAIERLRHLIAPGAQPSKGWDVLRQNLQIDRAYLDLITNESAGPRHGDPKHVPGVTTTEVTRRAWVVMNRFLEYRKRGNAPLPIPEFPILTS